jgi:hypothetical protein
MDAGRVVINPLIYAEVSVGYQRIEELEELLPASDYERELMPYVAGSRSAKHSCGIAVRAATSGHPCRTSTSARTPP